MKENYDFHRYVIHKVESVLKKNFFTFIRSQYLLRNIDALLAFLTDRGINVRPAFFYTKAFVYNSVAICLIMIKLLHHAV